MRHREPRPAAISYEPWRGPLTGLVRGGPMPGWAVPECGVEWDRPGAWWLDCLVTYENDRVEGLVLAVVPPEGVDLLKEAARILGRFCVVSAVVCHVRRPMTPEQIGAIRLENARLTRLYREKAA